MPRRTTRYYEGYWDAAEYTAKHNAVNPSAASALLKIVVDERSRVEGHRRLAEESIAALDRAASGDIVKVMLVKGQKAPYATQIQECDARLRELAQIFVTVQATISSDD